MPYYVAILIRKWHYWQRSEHTDQWNRREHTELDLHDHDNAPCFFFPLERHKAILIKERVAFLTNGVKQLNICRPIQKL